MQSIIDIIAPYVDKVVYYFLESVEVIGELAQRLIDIYFPSLFV